MDEIVKRLRDIGERFIFQGGSVFARALADRLEEVERLRAEREADKALMRQALDALESETDPFDCYDETTVTIAALRARLGDKHE